METDNSGAVQAVYNYGNDLISMNRAGVNSYYHYDGLGSTRQMTDDSETVVASYTYDGFGNLIASTGTIVNTYGFTGEQQFGEADNLVFLRARYYKPSIGRFISRDPIGYSDGSNIYAYVKNNPIKYTDPSGIVCCSECQTNYQKQSATALSNFKDCMADCGIVMSPWTTLCIIACAFTPNPPVCIKICLKVATIGGIICASGCMAAYRAEMEGIDYAHEYCLKNCEPG